MITCCTFDSAVINSIKSEQQVFLISVSLFLSVFLSYCVCLFLFFCLSRCPLLSLPVSVSLFVSVCLCLYIFVCLYLSLSLVVFVCLFLSPSVFVCFCLCQSLYVSILLCLSLSTQSLQHIKTSLNFCKSGPQAKC